MSEPATRAGEVASLAPDLLHWTVSDDRLGGFRSDAYALLTGEGALLIDPLPLEEELLSRLEPVAGILLTSWVHERSAWRLRKRYGVPVYAPAGEGSFEEQPDRRYGEEEPLPGGLVAIPAPGPHQPHALLHRAEGAGILFCGDLLIRPDGAPLQPLPAEHAPDSAAVLETTRKTLDLAFETLCPAHCAPLVQGGHAAVQKLLAP